MKLFILGAGASVPYGYPGGRELRSLMMENLSDPLKLQELTSPFNDEMKPKTLKLFDQLKEKLQKAGGTPLDFILEQNKDLASLGKLLIAQTILSCEDEERLFNEEECWYTWLFQQLRANDYQSFGRKNVQFITFNYDLSLEHFLFTAFRTLYGNQVQSDMKAWEIVGRVRIYHIYGQAGLLPWQGEGYTRKYGGHFSIEDVKECAKRIRLMYELKNKTDNIVGNMIKEAQEIHFLGFGFSEPNLARLKIYRSENRKKVCGGTLFGKNRLEKSMIQSRFKEFREELLDNDMTAYQYLSENFTL